MRVLFIGDIYGSLGREALSKYLPKIKEEEKPNLIIVNGENAAHGRGITEGIYKEFMELGINVITMGNHTFGNPQIIDLFEKDVKIIRPANFGNVPGKGYVNFNYNNKKITVVNLLGRTYMAAAVHCPFATMDKILEENKDSDYIFVDFHGEATSEKVAFGHDFDGKVNVIVGTHTHVPTADDRFLPKGTAFQSDLGMVGALNGVIGVEKSIVITRFREGHAGKNEPETDQRLQFNGLLVDLNLKKIKRINIFE